jgi:lipoate-protein ligase B
LPVTDYLAAWRLQTDLVEARRNRVLDRNVILFLEHLPVFTVGRRAKLNDVVISPDALKQSGVPVVHVERGGNMTFHAPGQLVVYPIIDLRETKIRVTDYVERLEEVMIRTVAQWNISAERSTLGKGVWVGKRKLGSLGIAIRHGVSFHGCALNVNVSLEPFKWIRPCGLSDIAMTSMQEECGTSITVKEVRRSLRNHFQTVFGVTLLSTTISDLQNCLKVPA